MRSLRSLLLVAATALSVLFTTATYADKPVFYDHHLVVTFQDDSCGFPLQVHIDQTYRGDLFFDSSGNLTRLTRHADGTVTLTNLDTGKTLEGELSRELNITLNSAPPVSNPDGSITFVNRFKGLGVHWVIPGYGAVDTEAGILDQYLTFAPDGTFISDVGVPVAGHFLATASARLCAALQ